MDTAIRSYLSGSYLLENESNEWSSIVILDSGVRPTSFVADHCQKHIYLVFDDITRSEVQKHAVQPSHLQQAIEFAKGTKKLLICCRAGQSRSAATAYVIAYAICGRAIALNLLNPKRHVPNKLIVEVGAKLLNKPEMFTDFCNWQQENRQLRLSDFYDDIEAEVEALERQGARNHIICNVF